MYDLGRQLKAMRHARDMSQREVAKAAGIAPWLLSRIESGKHDFKHSSIERVLEVLGAEVKRLPEKGEADSGRRSR